VHDLRLLRERPGELREALRRRGMLDTTGPEVDRAEALERQRRTCIHAAEEKRAEANALTQEVRRHKQAQLDATGLIERGRVLGAELDRLEEERAATEAAFTALALEFPNITLPDVPAGGETANVVIRSWGTPRPADGLRPHWDIAGPDGLGILDLARGAKVAGSGFVAFRGLGARLVRSLMTLMIDLHTREHGYEEVWIPFVVNRASMTGTAQFPKFEEEQYGIAGDDLFLIPTAEVPVTNLYRDEILDAAALPRGFVTYSPCFRREAGAHGKDTRGLLRLHQFDKVELVRYCAPDESPAQLELMTGHAEAVLQRLGLPYRVVLLAAGDTGFAAAKTYDLEVWAPGVGRWLEVSSCSTCTDFQARRANIRFRPGGAAKPAFAHTLNGSAIAFPRLIAALIEHYQEPGGGVRVPDALRPAMGADRLG
jgi:seryl-tRNA synthetase